MPARRNQTPPDCYNRTIVTLWNYDAMGFEQLAALKRELTAKAEQERQAKRGNRKERVSQRPATPKNNQKNAEPVDPVVITISRLQRLFPKAFPKKPAPKVPLKLGIHKELHLQAETLKLTPEEITEAVKTWCQGSRYWACMVQDAPRLDLSGEPSGTVTAAEAQFAKKLAARQRANAAKSRKAARQPDPQPAKDTHAEPENQPDPTTQAAEPETGTLDV